MADRKMFKFVILRTTSYLKNSTHLYKLLANLLSTGMGMPCEILIVDGKEGRDSNGTWLGTIGMVHRGEADIAVAPYVITQERKTVVDFSYPFYLDAITFATPKTETLPEISAILRPFNLEVWIALILSAVMMALILYCFLNKKKNFSDILICCVAVLLRQPVAFKHPAAKLLMFTSLLGVMFVTSCYLSLLLSYLTFPPANKMRDISKLSKEVRNGRYRVMSRNGPIVDLLSQSQHESVNVIGKSIVKDPMGFGNITSFIERSRDSKLAYIDERNIAKYLSSDYFVSDDYFLFYMCGVVIQKTFCCKEKLDMFVHRITAGGLYQKIFQDNVLDSIYPVFSKTGFKADTHKPLSLGHLTGAFIILAVGHFLASILLLLEIFVKRCKTVYGTSEKLFHKKCKQHVFRKKSLIKAAL